MNKALLDHFAVRLRDMRVSTMKRRTFLISTLTLLLMSCAASMDRREYTGPTDCDEVLEKLRTGNTGEFKGNRAGQVLSLCATGAGDPR